MKYSITIPAYKATFFRECLESILSQTYDDYEIIILNDCSPENIRCIIEEFSSHINFNKIRYYENETNVGAINVVDNWNKLLSLANGDFIICMGDDDKLSSNILSEYNSLISEFPNLNVYHARTMMIDEDSKFCNLQEERPKYQSVYSLIWHYTFKEGIHFVGDYLYRTSVLREKGGFFKSPLAWGADSITVFIAASSYGIANTTTPLFYYRQNSKSITSSSDMRLKMQSTKSYYEWMINFLESKPENESDYNYWYLIKNGIKAKIQHHEIYMIGYDIKQNFFSSFWYWLRKRREFGLSFTQFIFAVGLGLAMKVR